MRNLLGSEETSASVLRLMILSSLLIVSLAAATPASRPATRPAPPRAAVPMVVPFIQDDYARALADARARGVPLFIEAWAPW